MDNHSFNVPFSTKWIVEIPMRLPGFNEYIKACRGNKMYGNKLKQDVEQEISIFIADLPRFEKPIKIHFHWQEENKRRDLDNISVGKKFILDAMVKTGKLKDDNRRFVTAFTDTFGYGKESKVTLEIEEVDDET